MTAHTETPVTRTDPGAHAEVFRQPRPSPLASEPPAIDLSVVICTLQRPDLLRDAVRSCVRQTLPPGRAHEVVVVDNCPRQSAAPVVAALSAELALAAPLRYVHEPRTNLSHARNTGVAASQGRYVAFVDDDNIAPETWAATALDVIDRTGACVLFGDVEPVLPEAIDPDPEVRSYYCRRIAAPDEGVAPILASGHVRGGRTCNVVLDREACFPEGATWFDPVFGLSGGEDTDFFMRLADRVPQDRFRTSAKAVMQEVIPAERATPDVVVARTYKGSQRLVWALVRNSPAALTTWAAVGAVAVVQLSVAAARLAAARVARRAPSLGERVAYASAAGKLAHGALARVEAPHR